MGVFRLYSIAPAIKNKPTLVIFLTFHNVIFISDNTKETIYEVMSRLYLLIYPKYP